MPEGRRDITVESLMSADVQPGDLVCITGYALAVAQTRDPLLAWLETLPEAPTAVEVEGFLRRR